MFVCFPFSLFLPCLIICFTGMQQIRSQNRYFLLRMYFLARLFIQYYLLMNELVFNPQSFLIRNSMQMHSKLVFRILLKEFLGGLEFPGNWMTTPCCGNKNCTFIRVENLSIWAFVLTTLEPVNQKLDHPFLEIIENSSRYIVKQVLFKWTNWPNWWLDFQNCQVLCYFEFTFFGFFRLVIF